MFRHIIRSFHSTNVFASNFKSDLAKLRKKTGYTFANCKKALEANNNDVEVAEKWLKDQAQALGWSKASKLQGRTTAQGLIGLAVKNNAGVIVEVNCETDFVARNKNFRSLVELVTNSCVKNLPKSTQRIQQLTFDSTDLKGFEGPDNKRLEDHVALAISSLGENISLRRALVVTSSDLSIAGYTHPAPDNYSAKVMSGKYGALIAYSAESNDANQDIGKQLCQHIVGMNPSKVGDPANDEPSENKDDEMIMIHQDFLLDPSITVGQLLEGSGVAIHNFWRFECGEEIRLEEDQRATASQAA